MFFSDTAIASNIVSRADAAFGYGRDGAITLISDPLPDGYWQHPLRAFSPLLRSRIPGLNGAWIKYEGSHISGSFKDRIIGPTLGELLARQPDCPGVVVPSSGNAAVSAAALCAQRGLAMIAVVPAATPSERLKPITARGAVVVQAGEGPSAAYALADEIAEAMGFFPLYSTFASPWAEWGCRSIGRELAVQLQGRIGAVVAPVSAGPVLVGTANGLREAGCAVPPLFAVQSAGCAPIARAFEEGWDTVQPWTDPVETAAVAIADRLSGYPQDGTCTLQAVRSSKGAAISVSDAEMAAARAALFEYDGIDAEFSACAGVAWLRREKQNVPPETVCLVTASGFKHSFAGDVPSFPASSLRLHERTTSLVSRLETPAIVVS